MKQQFASNYDDPVIANQRLKNKLDFLERQSIKRQNYLKQVQRNLKLSKQTIKSLTQKSPSSNEMISQLNQQNSVLLSKLSQEYQSVCKLNALYLMQCQLRLQQSKSYNERVREFEQNMAELRRYLHDKEESFSFVAEKLKRFEELLPNQQVSMFDKLIGYSGVINQTVTWKQVITEMMEDRDFWKNKCIGQQQNCRKLQIAIHACKDSASYEKVQSLISNLTNEQTNKVYSGISTSISSISNGQPCTIADIKNQSNQPTNVTLTTQNNLTIEPNVELIRLMKRQKLNNKILQAALTQAIDKNLQLIEGNRRLIEANQSLRVQVDEMIADNVILSHALKQYNEHLKAKINNYKHIWAKCDIDRPFYRELIDKYRKNDLQEAKFILFTKMRRQIQEMTEYINLCPIQKNNKIKSYESPERVQRQFIMDSSFNSKEFVVSQI